MGGGEGLCSREDWCRTPAACGAMHLHPVERSGVVVSLDEVLADLRAQDLEDVAHPPEDREVADDGVLRLAHVAESEQPVDPNGAGDDQRFLTDSKKVEGACGS